MNLNHLVISGNCVRDPELRTVGADKTVCSFTIASSSRYKGQDGEQREETTFLDCEAWGRQGEIAAQYLQKGSLTIVEGSIKQDNWTDKESGQKRSKIKLRVERVHLMPKGGDRHEQQEAPTGQQPASRPRPAPMSLSARAAMMDDEPPF